jgi:hypothetical protein
MIRDNLPPSDLESMEKFEIWYRIDSMAAQFQRAKTIPPDFIPAQKTTRKIVQLIIEESRRKYALPCPPKVREIIKRQLMPVLKNQGYVVYIVRSLVRAAVGRHASGRFSDISCPKDARTQTQRVSFSSRLTFLES